MSGSARDQQVECLKFEYTGDKNFYPGKILNCFFCTLFQCVN